MKPFRSVVAAASTLAVMACHTAAIGGGATAPVPVAQQSAPAVGNPAPTTAGTATVAAGSFAGRADAGRIGIAAPRANGVEGTQSFAPASTRTIVIIALVAAVVIVAVVLANGISEDGY